MGQMAMGKPPRVYSLWVNRNEISIPSPNPVVSLVQLWPSSHNPKHRPSLGKAKVTQWPTATSCVMITFGVRPSTSAVGMRCLAFQMRRSFVTGYIDAHGWDRPNVQNASLSLSFFSRLSKLAMLDTRVESTLERLCLPLKCTCSSTTVVLSRLIFSLENELEVTPNLKRMPAMHKRLFSLCPSASFFCFGSPKGCLLISSHFTGFDSDLLFFYSK